MRLARTALLVSFPLLAQEAPFFQEEAPKPWLPAWELTLRADRTSIRFPSAWDIDRSWARLRLRWTFEGEAWAAGLGTRSSVGSDGNRFNTPRYDQQPSNGTQWDQAWFSLHVQSPHSFGELKLGLQENALISQESLWDQDLRLNGASLRAALRNDQVQEFGLRATAGRVRTLPGGRVDLVAAQVVMRLDTGPFSWLAHGGRWRLDFDASDEREHPVPGVASNLRQRLTLDAVGGAWTWHAQFPVELRVIHQKNPDTRESGAEYQAWLGSRNHVWWPQLGYVWQRYDHTGTLYPVGGDDWWFMWNARGPRYEAALPLPGKWLLSATYLRHQWYGHPLPVERRFISLRKRF